MAYKYVGDGIGRDVRDVRGCRAIGIDAGAGMELVMRRIGWKMDERRRRVDEWVLIVL